MLVQCCVCGRIRKDAKWVAAKEVASQNIQISHGYCPACAAKAFAEIQKIHQSEEPSTVGAALTA